MHLRFLLPALLVTLAMLGTVDASGNAVTINGASCTPSNAAIQSDLYLDTAGSTSWQSGASGDITLYCPIQFPDLVSSDCSEKLEVTVLDQDGSGSGVNVTAQLIQLEYDDGTLTNIGTALNSNSYGSYECSGAPPCNNVVVMTESYTTCLDDLDYYYVRIDLNRTSGTTYWSTLYGVQLQGS